MSNADKMLMELGYKLHKKTMEFEIWTNQFERTISFEENMTLKRNGKGYEIHDKHIIVDITLSEHLAVHE